MQRNNNEIKNNFIYLSLPSLHFASAIFTELLKWNIAVGLYMPGEFVKYMQGTFPTKTSQQDAWQNQHFF